jgi:hypothetical protein
MSKDLIRVAETSAPALRHPLTPAQFCDLVDIPPLLTRDRGFYRRYFAGLDVLDPST